jgi:predicted TIM-barrel enzyme
MSSKQRKSKKTKRIPVREITARTVETTVSPVAIRNRVTEEQSQDAVLITGSSAGNSSLVIELKRIGLISACVVVLLVILSLIF